MKFTLGILVFFLIMALSAPVWACGGAGGKNKSMTPAGTEMPVGGKSVKS